MKEHHYSAVLSPDDVERLTGYKKAKLQCEWLAKKGYAFDTNSKGEPVVSSAYYATRFDPKLFNNKSMRIEPNMGMFA